MPVADKAVKERRSGTRELVDKLTAERAEMLVSFCRVAGLDPFQVGKSGKQIPRLLQEFCQILIDYIASGHFLLYERIANGQERRREVSELAGKIYSRIAATTDAALSFNDKYDCEDHCETLDQLSEDLSRLGEQIALRIELEDKLLMTLTRRSAT